jgi:hypothetical protein
MGNVTILTEFSRVNSDCPCPICGREDWCMISHDGFTAICGRVESSRPFGNAGFAHLLTQKLHAPPPTHSVPQLSPEDIEYRVRKAIAHCTLRRLDMLANSLGITRASLQRLHVGWNRRLGCFTFPMQNERFEFAGIRYRFPNGEKRSLKGGGHGLFIPTGVMGQKWLFIAEGPTDCAAVLDCGLPAIGRPNNLGGITEIVSLARRFRPAMLVIVDDADKAGAIGGDKLQQALSPQELGYRAVIKRLRPARYKDARETIRAGGRRESIIGALDHKSNHYWVAR